MKSRWISTAKKLPIVGEKVEVYIIGGHYTSGELTQHEGWKVFDGFKTNMSMRFVIAWQPRPTYLTESQVAEFKIAALRKWGGSE